MTRSEIIKNTHLLFVQRATRFDRGDWFGGVEVFTRLSGGLDGERGGGPEAYEIVHGVAGATGGGAVVDPVDSHAVARVPPDVGELVLAGEGHGSIRQVGVGGLPVRHRTLEHRLQRQSDLTESMMAKMVGIGTSSRLQSSIVSHENITGKILCLIFLLDVNESIVE